MEMLDVTHFGGVYRRTRVLVTGHTGFKGSWLTYWLSRLGAEVSGLALPPETTPNHYDLLPLTLPDALHDIRDATRVCILVKLYQRPFENRFQAVSACSISSRRSTVIG